MINEELLNSIKYFYDVMNDVNECSCVQIRRETLEKFSLINIIAEKNYIDFSDKMMKHAGYMLNYGIKNNDSKVKKLAGRFLNAGVKLKKNSEELQAVEKLLFG